MNPASQLKPMTADATDALVARKAQLRDQVLAARDALSPEVRLAQSRACIAQLFAQPEWQAAKCVMAYASFGSELDMSSLLEACVLGPRRLALPRIERSPPLRLAVHWVDDLASLIGGQWGIREPAVHTPIATLSDIDCIIVPGVAFDRAGNRLGYGKGFYDRLLHARGGTLKVMGLALDCQLVEAVPHGERDERIDILITPQGIWRFE